VNRVLRATVGSEGEKHSQGFKNGIIRKAFYILYPLSPILYYTECPETIDTLLICYIKVTITVIKL
jgi:hypothetical protein